MATKVLENKIRFKNLINILPLKPYFLGSSAKSMGNLIYLLSHMIKIIILTHWVSSAGEQLS